MVKKFVLWFISFGLSFLVASWGWTEQGKAFLFINLATTILLLLFILVIFLISIFVGQCDLLISGLTFTTILLATGTIAISLFATWGATKLFDIDFFVAYQIMTFGQCLCPNNKKKDD